MEHLKLCLQLVTGVSALPLWTGESWGTVGIRLFQKMGKPRSFCLAQLERTCMEQCRAIVLSFDVLLGCLEQ